MTRHAEQPGEHSVKHVRALKHASKAIRARVRYVCDAFFGGNVSRFATALSINYNHLYQAVCNKSQVTSSMLAQIVDRMPIRAEWLLTGAGPMLVTPENRVEPRFELPPAIQSAFPVFDTARNASLPPAKLKLSCRKRTGIDGLPAAAHAIYRCRVAGTPVCFFLGSDAASRCQVRVAVREFFSKNYATSLAVTAGCLPHELAHDADFNFVVRTTAAHGIGLGEGLCRWALARTQTKKKLLAQVWAARRPITVHAELAEFPQPLNTTLFGAETGAAWGAAAYVDYLVLAEQIRQCAGGVFVLLGEPDRGWNLFATTLSAIRGACPSESIDNFLTIYIGPTRKDIQEQVLSHGGRFYNIRGTYAAGVKKLLQACDSVYDGTIPNDNK